MGNFNELAATQCLNALEKQIFTSNATAIGICLAGIALGFGVGYWTARKHGRDSWTKNSKH